MRLNGVSLDVNAITSTLFLHDSTNIETLLHTTFTWHQLPFRNGRFHYYMTFQHLIKTWQYSWTAMIYYIQQNEFCISITVLCSLSYETFSRSLKFFMYSKDYFEQAFISSFFFPKYYGEYTISFLLQFLTA